MILHYWVVPMSASAAVMNLHIEIVPFHLNPLISGIKIRVLVVFFCIPLRQFTEYYWTGMDLFH